MSHKMQTDPVEGLKNYFISAAKVLNDKFEATNTDGHPSATGNKREKLLIDFLNEHLPSRHEAYKGGSIFDANGNQSDQVDVVVYDRSTPRLGKESETLFMAEGVACAIEVKPNLDNEELTKGYSKIDSFKQVTKSITMSLTQGSVSNKVYSGIFAFSTTLDPIEEIGPKTVEYYKEKDSEFCPDFICVNNSFLIIKNDNSWTEKTPSGETAKVTERFIYFPTVELSLYKLLMIMSGRINQLYLGGPDFSKYINLY